MAAGEAKVPRSSVCAHTAEVNIDVSVNAMQSWLRIVMERSWLLKQRCTTGEEYVASHDGKLI
jgi:hypothetical protein